MAQRIKKPLYPNPADQKKYTPIEFYTVDRAFQKNQTKRKKIIHSVKNSTTCLKTQEHRDSFFCLSHPIGKMDLKGKCEWLKPHCALGFDSNQHSAINIINDDNYLNYEFAKLHLNSANLHNESITTAKNPCFLFP